MKAQLPDSELDLPVGGAAPALHAAEQARLEMVVAALAARSGRLSVARLVTALLGPVLLLTGLKAPSPLAVLTGAASCAAFVVLVVLQDRLHKQRDRDALRVLAHARHLARADGTWLARACDAAYDERHPYAFDIDLSGPGSLLARIDVTRTTRGKALLLGWLGESLADAPELRARQRAVAELSLAPLLRVELEVAAQHGADGAPLSAERFVEFTRAPPVLAPFHRLAMWLCPALTGLTFAGGQLGLLGAHVWLLPCAVQAAIIVRMWLVARRYFDLLDARRTELEAFGRLLATLEQASLRAPLLSDLQRRLTTAGSRPSQHLQRLSGWAGLAEVRMQFLVHPALNLFLLWDLHVLRGLERWNEQAGRHVDEWLRVIAELEALASLAALHGADPGCTFPHIASAHEGLHATALAHPLLTARERVPNDLVLEAPGCALIVTGSNMAGKSTLLRALGLNVALALAGGPVCAERMAVPRVRLRASMRASDALQKGASYFYAELLKLRTVVAELRAEPPVLFLLDELLRGTNAHARTVGARAVLRHLTCAGALGLVATHDPALCELQAEPGTTLRNVHFTDVLVDGEITFDYRLRPGPATTSNALRLLQLAGISLSTNDASAL